MWVYPHTDYVLRGYTRLTHEAIIFQSGQVKDVPEEVARFVVNQWPLQFCLLGERETAMEHSQACRLAGHPLYMNEELAEPPVDRQMVTMKRRGRPAKVRV